MSEKIEGLDSDGKLVVKVVPNQVHIDSDGNIVIQNRELMAFVQSKKIDSEAHIILMGSDCGCKCCC